MTDTNTLTEGHVTVETIYDSHTDLPCIDCDEVPEHPEPDQEGDE